MSDELVGYFGFGSLVNRNTLRTSYVDLVQASLKGYSRHWQSKTKTLEEQVALLSIHPDQTCEIYGMIVLDKLENLPLVDAREQGYSRHRLNRDQLLIDSDAAMPNDIYVYIANEPEGESDEGALLQSYLDAVMQGFFNEYGDEGVRHFMDTTKGFDRKLIRDRQSPKYPRPVMLSDSDATYFDSLVGPATR